MRGPTTAEGDWKPVWITDFPLVEWNDDEGRWDPLHHPFTSPTARRGETAIVPTGLFRHHERYALRSREAELMSKIDDVTSLESSTHRTRARPRRYSHDRRA